jgi:hypothetical protein
MLVVARASWRYRSRRSAAGAICGRCRRDDQLLGFEDASTEIPREHCQRSPLVRGRLRPLAEESFEDACLLVQEIDQTIELLVDRSGAGPDADGGFIV